MRRAPDRTSGFTLLEVVVTLAVLSLSLTAVYQVLTSVARGTRVSADYYKALEIAESQMAKLSTSARSLSGNNGTVDGRFHWTTSVQSYLLPADSPLAKGSLISLSDRNSQPYLLTVSVSWGDGQTRELNLNSIRLGAEP